MTRFTKTGRAVALLAATAVAGTLVAVTPSAAARDTGTAAADAAGNVHVTLKIGRCDGCEVQVFSFEQGDRSAWASLPKDVSDGEVRFRVPRSRASGMSVLVRAPWEGHTGYVTTVAFRYRGTQPGDVVSFDEAREMERASGCWAGTDADAATMRLIVRRVMVQGVHQKVPGSIAWAKVTQDWMRPLNPTPGGVLGSQDIILCRG